MNYRDHLTHWNGVPLKKMSQKELIHLCQELNRRLEEMRDTLVMSKQPKSESYSFWG